MLAKYIRSNLSRYYFRFIIYYKTFIYPYKHDEFCLFYIDTERKTPKSKTPKDKQKKSRKPPSGTTDNSPSTEREEDDVDLESFPIAPQPHSPSPKVSRQEYLSGVSKHYLL